MPTRKPTPKPAPARPARRRPAPADQKILGRLEAGLENLTNNFDEMRKSIWQRVDRIDREKVSHHDLSEHFVRIERKLDDLKEDSGREMKEIKAGAEREHKDHESRLRVLEQFRWKTVALATAASGVAAKLILTFWPAAAAVQHTVPPK